MYTGCIRHTGRIDTVERYADGAVVHVETPALDLDPGDSVAVDGVCLTVDSVDDDAGTFAVAVVPETYERTTLSRRDAGDAIHFEADTLARYAARASEVRA